MQWVWQIRNQRSTDIHLVYPSSPPVTCSQIPIGLSICYHVPFTWLHLCNEPDKYAIAPSIIAHSKLSWSYCPPTFTSSLSIRLLWPVPRYCLVAWSAIAHFKSLPLPIVYFLLLYPSSASIWTGATVQSIVYHMAAPTLTDGHWALHFPKNNFCTLMSCIFNVSTKLDRQPQPRQPSRLRLRNLRLLVLNYLQLCFLTILLCPTRPLIVPYLKPILHHLMITLFS